MKRWTLRILLLVILGAVTTVAVAWGCAVILWPDWNWENGIAWKSSDHQHTRGSIVYTATMSGMSWMCTATYSRGVMGTIFPPTENEWSEIIPAWAEGTPPPPRFTDSELPQTHSRFDMASGYPGLAMVGGMSSSDRDAAWRQDAGIYIGATELFWDGGSSSQPTMLPLRPIWPGFLIDTLFYATIWCGIFFGFASARRASRRRRGHCPKCNYDLRGELDKGCSECGWRRPP